MNDLNGILPLEFIDECKNSKVYMMNLVSDLKNTEIKKGTYIFVKNWESYACFV